MLQRPQLKTTIGLLTLRPAQRGEKRTSEYTSKQNINNMHMHKKNIYIYTYSNDIAHVTVMILISELMK